MTKNSYPRRNLCLALRQIFDFVALTKQSKRLLRRKVGPVLLDSVKNSFEIRNGEKSVDELGISAPNDKEFIVEVNVHYPRRNLCLALRQIFDFVALTKQSKRLLRRKC
jgi:ABC-type oligopeptide transport system substrate-binding subunit